MTSDSRLRRLEACNQRGGRMLSLVDLIAAGTVDLDLAGYLAAVMRRGSSLLVGANPGGAGKTTVMVALLQFLPDDVAIVPVADDGVLARARRDRAVGQTCYLAHEIGAGTYYAYVWGAAARAFFSLAGQGHLIASNLHADTLAETRAQLCGENGVDPEDVLAVTLKAYLRLDRGSGWHRDRRLAAVYESDGREDVLVWTHERGAGFVRHASSSVVTPEAEAAWRGFLAELAAAGLLRLGQVGARIREAGP